MVRSSTCQNRPWKVTPSSVKRRRMRSRLSSVRLPRSFRATPGGGELIWVPPDRNSKPESATGKHVQRSDFLGEDHGMTEGEHQRGRSQAHPVGYRGSSRQGGHGVEP